MPDVFFSSGRYRLRVYRIRSMNKNRSQSNLVSCYVSCNVCSLLIVQKMILFGQVQSPNSLFNMFFAARALAAKKHIVYQVSKYSDINKSLLSC